MTFKLWVPSLATVCFLLGASAIQSAWAEPIVQTEHQASQTTWSEFSSDSGGFSISMPAAPEEEVVQEFLHMFSVEHDGWIYAVGYADFEQEILNTLMRENPQAFWDGIRRSLVQDGQASLLDDRPIVLNGVVGREMQYEDANGLLNKLRVFVVNRRIYQIMAAEAVDAPVAPSVIEPETFLESFQFISR